ncbi:hypothetical protein Salat_1795000 [Sesamum alatum]|uniref:Uncharacterized protein n=1 Tax=Sesamum alatum TaxID=300844 RepID=A0AAE1Y2L7_9LAMI|nr:hypothetical protein Salat_1795000 [Sesamum alatum]
MTERLVPPARITADRGGCSKAAGQALQSPKHVGHQASECYTKGNAPKQSEGNNDTKIDAHKVIVNLTERIATPAIATVDKGECSKAAEQPLIPRDDHTHVKGNNLGDTTTDSGYRIATKLSYEHNDCCEGTTMENPPKPVGELNEEHEHGNGNAKVSKDAASNRQWAQVGNAYMMLDHDDDSNDAHGANTKPPDKEDTNRPGLHDLEGNSSEVNAMPICILHPACPTNFNPRDIEPGDAALTEQSPISKNQAERPQLDNVFFTYEEKMEFLNKRSKSCGPRIRLTRCKARRRKKQNGNIMNTC